jgi:hypothetical protein
MPGEVLDPGHQNASVLRDELLTADDRKVRQVVGLIDSLSNAAVNQAILGSLRSRLAVIEPVRPLHFARLLFLPLDPLVVPADDWRPGDPTVPRSAIASISQTVRTGLGSHAEAIQKTITGHGTDAAEVIALAGEMLWSRAAVMLTETPSPIGWERTGLPPTAYQPLGRAIAGVLRRAVWLESLARDAANRAVEPNHKIVNDIMEDIASENAEGYAMIVRLVLLRSPHATSVMREIVWRKREPAETAMLRQAVAQGMEHLLAYMESASGLSNEIGHTIATAADEVRRVVTVLQEIEGGLAQDRPRVKAVRKRLDDVCRERFSVGVREVLVTPLTTASGPIDNSGQRRLEGGARELRTLEAVARKVGSPESYDRLLLQTSDTVRAAVEHGTLTPIRGLRLVEILSGPEAAESMYMECAVSPSGKP